MLAVGGSVVAAVLSSACCWLPLVLISFGASAVGVAGFFEQWRRPLLAVACVFLAIGFFVSYRPRRVQSGDCCSPARRAGRLQRTSLWIATAFVVAMALFPQYVGALVSALSPPATASTSEKRVTLSVWVG